ncbi:hypothetical protein TNCV_3098111 [Trichonephila clavipes]|nr:hypothetical protein TNCV_3098111 [Trichonephila clavipes]
MHCPESFRANFQVQRFSIQLPRQCPSSSGTPPVNQECARGISALLRKGKFSQLARGNRGLMVVKGGEQQNFFQELGLYAMALENLLKFKDICNGTFPNPVHEGVHEEEDISYCTMLKSYQFAKYLQQFNKLHAEWSYKVTVQ